MKMKEENSKNGDKSLKQFVTNLLGVEERRSRLWIGNDYIHAPDRPAPRTRIRSKSITSEKWIRKIFDSKIATEGGVARRKLSSIDKFADRAWVFDEASKRGFYVIRVREQWVFICNQCELRIVPRTDITG